MADAANLDPAEAIDPVALGNQCKGEVTAHAEGRRLPSGKEDDDSEDESEVSCVTKYTIFVFNVIFFILGFALVAVGTYSQIDNGGIYKNMQNVGQFAVDPTLFLILIGILIFIIGFCGCLGSLRENTILLTIYAWSLIIIVVLECAIALGLYFYKETMMKTVGDFLYGLIPNYSEVENLQDIWDQLQMMFSCCGINNVNDWDASSTFMRDTSPQAGPDSGGVPFSCCVNPFIEVISNEDATKITKEVNTACGRQTRPKEDSNHIAIFQVGCLTAIDTYVNANAQAVLITFAVVLIVQAVAIMLAQNLKADVKAQRAKWLE
ncbi:hypothetical protein PENTCL1PPCAC_11983 [Pristionchus entomophagus]|uniref:Tetraspanin n=1 Tax=Pristionchus entomophagus TaxID=358040 RepID=A0AAV5T3E2_9BILA|nr:hypothetical protein PENTCL1PPCAC_11983 [Pristionchus entomophagus]